MFDTGMWNLSAKLLIHPGEKKKVFVKESQGWKNIAFRRILLQNISWNWDDGKSNLRILCENFQLDLVRSAALVNPKEEFAGEATLRFYVICQKMEASFVMRALCLWKFKYQKLFYTFSCAMLKWAWKMLIAWNIQIFTMSNFCDFIRV